MNGLDLLGARPARTPVAKPSATPAKTSRAAAAAAPTSTPAGRLAVSPPSAAVAAGGACPFSAQVLDAAGKPLDAQPTFAWSASGGTIDDTGNFTAPAPGTYTVTVSGGGMTATARVTVYAPGAETGGEDGEDDEDGDAADPSEASDDEDRMSLAEDDAVDLHEESDYLIENRATVEEISEEDNRPRLRQHYPSMADLEGDPVDPTAVDDWAGLDLLGHSGGGHGGGGHGGHGGGRGRRGFGGIAFPYPAGFMYDGWTDVNVEIDDEDVENGLDLLGAGPVDQPGLGIRDGRGYGPYNQGYYYDKRGRGGVLPYGPKGERLPSVDYDFQGNLLSGMRAPKQWAEGVTIADAARLWPVRADGKGIDFSRARRPQRTIGALADTVTDYDYGETKVIELVQFFNALGRPAAFEPDAERVYAAYEKAKAWEPFGPDKVLRWKNATAMKQVGADAAVVTDKIRVSGAHGDGKVAASSTIPTSISNPVYKPGVDDGNKSWFSLSNVPWWIWAGGATIAGGTALYFLAPLIAAAVARRAARGGARLALGGR